MQLRKAKEATEKRLISIGCRKGGPELFLRLVGPLDFGRDIKPDDAMATKAKAEIEAARLPPHSGGTTMASLRPINMFPLTPCILLQTNPFGSIAKLEGTGLHFDQGAASPPYTDDYGMAFPPSMYRDGTQPPRNIGTATGNSARG
jgi:hypothetical protein